MRSGNVFINTIYDKVKPSFRTLFKYLKHKKAKEKLIKTINNGSPSFGLLWKMADFIKYSEELFFYDNSTKNEDIGLYSSRGYSPGCNGFKINDNDCWITIKLFSESQKTVVELERKFGEHYKTNMTFVNDMWDSENTIYNEMILEQIIKIINKRVIMLFEWCYNRR